MLRFDRAVNHILNHLIFEQDESVEIEKEDDRPLNKEDAIIADIQRKYDKRDAAFLAQAGTIPYTFGMPSPDAAAAPTARTQMQRS